MCKISDLLLAMFVLLQLCLILRLLFFFFKLANFFHYFPFSPIFYIYIHLIHGLSWWKSDGKKYACNVGDLGLISGLGRSPGGRDGNPLQYTLLENPHGQRSLTGYSPLGHEGLDMTEQLSTAHLIYIHSFFSYLDILCICNFLLYLLLLATIL